MATAFILYGLGWLLVGVILGRHIERFLKKIGG